MRASERALEALHGEIAKTLKVELERYGSGYYKDGGDNPLPVPSALLSASIKFLKDNRIDSAELDEPDPSDLLADELPDFN